MKKSNSIELSSLIKSKETIIFSENIIDKDYPEILWSIYGIPKTNEIVVSASVKDISFYIAAESRLKFPLMIDRICGIDISDQQLAAELSDQLWDKHKNELLSLF